MSFLPAVGKLSVNGDSTVIDAYSAFATDEQSDALPFYEAEGQLLALWDRLQEQNLEKAILECRAKAQPTPSVCSALPTPESTR